MPAELQGESNSGAAAGPRPDGLNADTCQCWHPPRREGSPGTGTSVQTSPPSLLCHSNNQGRGKSALAAPNGDLVRRAPAHRAAVEGVLEALLLEGL